MSSVCLKNKSELRKKRKSLRLTLRRSYMDYVTEYTRFTPYDFFSFSKLQANYMYIEHTTHISVYHSITNSTEWNAENSVLHIQL